ncbi:hypothetical protein ACLI1A_14980 [Flavobacterium sp. RHBU_3]|uniref:hypothetical protein n=1 Tax=Flavobacterium sp. RHBU_3 TaxID=3391184 RepID=UPI0039849FF4
MKTILILAILLHSSISFCQTNSEEKNITKIDSLVQNSLNFDKSNSYLIYSVERNILVIDSVNKTLYYLKRSKEGVLSSKKLSSKSINRIFNHKNIYKGYLFSNNKYDYSCASSFVYLSVTCKSSKIFQFYLPFMLMCDQNKVEYPFNEKVLEELHNFLQEFISKEG